jgi:hypothetical protein
MNEIEVPGQPKGDSRRINRRKRMSEAGKYVYEKYIAVGTIWRKP